MIKLSIAVTGLNNTDNPGPGIPVIRGIRDSREIEARIIGLAYENLEPGIFMHELVDKTYKVPYPSAGTGNLMERIRAIHAREPIDLLIPNFDAELYTFMKAAGELETLGIRTFMPSLQQYEERHKSNLPSYGEKYGVKVPYSEAVTSIHDLVGLKDRITFPVVIKGKFYDAFIAQNMEQAISYYHKMAAKWGLPVIVQEFIKGTEVNVVALGNGKGDTIAAVPMRKQFITDKGKAWAGITLDDPDLLELTHSLIRQTMWKGGMELEMIRNEKDELYLIEINPRIPAWVYLAVGAGQNIPEALVKLALGLPVEPMEHYAVGKMFVRYSFDMITDWKELEKLVMNEEL
ncbi:MAG: ATP-grasp domain-containing protein [Bacteroidota bacterium]